MLKVKKKKTLWYGLESSSVVSHTAESHSVSFTVCTGKIITDLTTLTTHKNPYSMEIIRFSASFGTALFHLFIAITVCRARTEALLMLM